MEPKLILHMELKVLHHFHIELKVLFLEHGPESD